MQAAQKKRLEEKNSKLIRELASIPANRNCFECGQRGPTYVNITEGSFCCTQCSGILRGLNPPHRVKSISMAAFTTDEVEKLGRLGNAENAKTWLGLYGGTPPAMTNRDAIQTFLVKKYEQKAWYLSKAELSEQERLMNQAKETASRTSSHGTGSVTSTTTNRPSNFDLLSDGNAWPLTDRSKPIITEPQPTGQAFSPPGFLAPPPPLSFDLPAAKPAPSAPNADLFGLFDSPRAPSDGTVAPSAHLPTAITSFINSQPSQIDPFADFDKKFSDLSVRPSNTVSGFNGLANQSVPVIPKSATVVSELSGVLQPMPTTVPAPNPFQINMAPMQPAQVSAPFPSTASAPVVPESSGDKYSALAELDELFHHTPSTNDGKPSWMPTGFSTGIPPSATTGNLNLNGTPKQQPARALVGSFPKSQTMHGISDFSGNNPFLQTIRSSQPFSQAAFPNPFGPPPAQGQYAVPPQMMMQPTQQQNWGMSQPIIPPRPTSSSTAATPNWNPFL